MDRNVDLVMSWVDYGCRHSPQAKKLVLSFVSRSGDGQMAAVIALGPIVANAVSLRRNAKSPGIVISQTAAEKLLDNPKKTQLARLLDCALPDVLCSTDGRRHDYGIFDYPQDVQKSAVGLLPDALAPSVAFKISKSLPVLPNHLGQYTFLRILMVNARDPVDVFVSRLTYQLRPREDAEYGKFHVPATTRTDTVVPKSRVLFPLLFEGGRRNKFSLVPSQTRPQKVYEIRAVFDLYHPKSATVKEFNRLGFDKKCVFLDDETISKNLSFIGKTTQVT